MDRVAAGVAAGTQVVGEIWDPAAGVVRRGEVAPEEAAADLKVTWKTGSRGREEGSIATPEEGRTRKVKMTINSRVGGGGTIFPRSRLFRGFFPHDYNLSTFLSQVKVVRRIIE